MERILNASYTSVYINCHQAAKQLEFKIFKEDIATGIILFKIGWSLWSFGEEFRITIESEGKNTTKVTIGSESSIGAQVYDWGKNKDNIILFFETLSLLMKG
jgi:hypothetical protein